MDRLTSLSNVLTVSRLVASPVLVVLTAYGAPALFLGLLVLAPVGRHRWPDSPGPRPAIGSWRVSRQLGRLRSLPCHPVAVVILEPRLIEQELFVIAAVFVAYAGPLLGGALKYGRLTSYHTTGARIAGILLSAATILLVAANLTWPARVAAVVLLIAAAEELAITCVLHEWRSDVPSLRAALRERGRPGIMD